MTEKEHETCGNCNNDTFYLIYDDNGGLMICTQCGWEGYT